MQDTLLGERRVLYLTADRGLPVEEPVVVLGWPSRPRCAKVLEERESRDLPAFALVRRRHRRFGEIETGNGSDVVVDGGGHNIVKTGNGGDQISTGAGDDEIDGGNGFDTCSPGGGSNRVKDCEGLPSPLP